MSRAQEVLFLVDGQTPRLVVCRRSRIRAGFRNGRSCAECASRSVSASCCLECYLDLAQLDCRFRAHSGCSPAPEAVIAARTIRLPMAAQMHRPIC